MAEPRSGGLILASASPFRRRMLEAAGLTFRVAAADVDEPAIRRRLAAGSVKAAPAGIAEALANAKAEAVSRREPAALVIGADQVLAVGDEIFAKPGSLAAAREQLVRLRGGTHELHTAVALGLGGRIVWGHADSATLTMRRFTEEFLEQYLHEAGSEVWGIVGAYQIEGRGIQLFERVVGDTFSIVGLPLLPLLAELRARGVIGS